ncbi:DUF6776 family protein [Psychromonas sp. Urea-02u-13]|uniref:DUF6776 family protein n=1 Tax=Psychromonas sp. Urea-02u-13 TaxID=2058326 RepID=UPI000C33DB3C|nr:DUF6776 family protein [Psychromonas sp. Urea-02u-13]PKG38574.1 hypothetical protein CXF74_12710 [Psychromonas sp. Urea-02u-13]
MKRLRNSVVKWLVISLLCLLLGFFLGKFKQDILDEKLSVMAVDLHTIKIRNQRVETDLSRVQIISVSDQQTIKSLLQSNKQLQNELAIVNNKLYFYEGVISPELEKTGVKAHSFEMTENAKTGGWDYELVLMQSKKGRRFLSGNIDISLSIFEGENLKKVSLSALTETLEKSFKFKYFQTVQGSFVLPEGMMVDEVIVNLNVVGNRWYKAQRVEQLYDWRVLTTHDVGDASEYDSSDNSTTP